MTNVPTMPPPFDLVPTGTTTYIVVLYHYVRPQGYYYARSFKVPVYQSEDNTPTRYARVSPAWLEHLRVNAEDYPVERVTLQSYNGNEWQLIDGEYVVRLTTV